MKKFRILVLGAVATVVSCGCSGGSAGNAPKAASQSPAVVEWTPAVPFSGDQALRYVEKQTGFGPRVPGTEAHESCRRWLADTLRAMGAQVHELDTVFAPGGGAPRRVRNIYALVRPEAPRQVLLAAHYDTRPWADEDPDPAKHASPIPGANDGGSGVAVILEIIRNAANADAGTGISVLLTDCEDSGNPPGATFDDELSWCVGSQAFAASLPSGFTRPNLSILLDMVGGEGAVFRRELFSNHYARTATDAVWQAAARTPHAARFPDAVGGAVNDDHLPLIQAGIPTVDIIEASHPSTGSFNPTWHTMADDTDNISAATLQAVGDVVTEAIYRN